MTDHRSPLFRFHDLEDRLADAFERSEGEVTEEIADLETQLALTASDALEGLAGFIVHCEAQAGMLKAEQDRIAAARKRVERAKAWAQRHMLRLLGSDRSRVVGTYKIGRRVSHRAVGPKDQEALEALGDLRLAEMSEVWTLRKDRIKEAWKACTEEQRAELRALGVDVVTHEKPTIK